MPRCTSFLDLKRNSYLYGNLWQEKKTNTNKRKNSFSLKYNSKKPKTSGLYQKSEVQISDQVINSRKEKKRTTLHFQRGKTPLMNRQFSCPRTNQKSVATPEKQSRLHIRYLGFNSRQSSRSYSMRIQYYVRAFKWVSSQTLQVLIFYLQQIKGTSYRIYSNTIKKMAKLLLSCCESDSMESNNILIHIFSP